VNRDHAIERLRVWAQRAQNEAQHADTLEDTLNWQGQSQVLGGTATYLSGPGVQADDSIIWKQVVADRAGALAAWEKEQEGPQAMYYAGMVAGYDVALTILADVMGKLHTDNTLRYG
jgi:hypothetical protein